MAAAAAARGRELSVTGAGDVAHPGHRHRALVATVGEAVRNAAAHAQGAIRVYVEVERGGGVTAWVSDEGPGFDLDAVPPDRLGIRGSIIDRMERAGGTAMCASTEVGTEWTLRLPPA